MPLARAAALAAVWSLAFAAVVHAYTVDVLHLQDARVTWALPVCAVAFGVGHLITFFGARRWTWPPLGPLRHGALFVVFAACVHGLAQVAPETTADALIRDVPPALAFVYPLLALLAPVVIGAGAARTDAADHVLCIALFLTVQSGAIFFLGGATALGIAIVAVLAQLGAGGRLPGRSPLAVSVVVVVAAIFVGAVAGPDEAFARPAFRYVLQAAFLLLAIALRPRDGDGWRRVLCAPVLAAVVVAVAELALTVDIGRRFSFEAAFDTRLILFRQHPNFLAPLFAFSGLLALGHALSRRRGAWLGLLAAVLLAYATWRTDSNTGKAAFAVGLMTLVGVSVLRRLVRRLGGRRVAVGVGVVAVLLVAAGSVVILREDGAGRAVSLIQRGEKSLDYRVDAWRNSLAVIAERPGYGVLGVGPRTFLLRTTFPAGSRFANENEIPHPHNALLYVAQAGGLLALAAFLAWLVAIGVRLGRRVGGAGGEGGDDGGLPPIVVAAVIAALAAQLFANLLDLGLALDTVVPWPVFVVTGLVLARDVRDRPAPVPGVGGLLVVGLAFVFVAEVWRPLRAETLVRRASVFGSQLDRTSHVEELRRRMCDVLRAARAQDPLAPASELLSKTLGELGGDEELEEAQAVLVDARDRAPDDGEVWSRLGRFLLARGRFEQASFALSYGDRGIRGAKDPDGDRALAVEAIAGANRTADAHAALVAALRQDHETLDRLEFERDSGGRTLLVVDGRRTNVDLGAAIDDVAASYRDRQLADEGVGRKPWMDLFHAALGAGFYAKAEGILDYVAENLPEVEAHSVAWDRGRLAKAQGDVDGALKWFREANALAVVPVPVYQDALRALEAEAGGAAAAASAPSMIARVSLGDVIEIRTAYRPHLDELAVALEAHGDAAGAAEVLHAMLLFVDGPIPRARVFERAARLEAELGDDDAALRSLDAALRHLWARRHYRGDSMLLEDGRSLPVVLALAECDVWRRRGLDDDAIVRAALSRPHGRAFRRASILYRLGLFEALERWDKLLEEAELALLQDEEDETATNAKRVALKQLGRTHELARFERALELTPSWLEGRARKGP